MQCFILSFEELVPRNNIRQATFWHIGIYLLMWHDKVVCFPHYRRKLKIVVSYKERIVVDGPITPKA